jgi:hypothetical protein
VDPSTLPSGLEAFVEINPISHVVDASRGLVYGDVAAGDVLLVLAEAAVLTAMDGTRRMLVAWLAQSAGSSGNAGGPGVVAAAVASPGKSFGRQQTLEADLPRGGTSTIIGGTAVQAAILRDRSVVAWTGAQNRQFVVRTADIVSGRANASTRLSTVGARSLLQGLAVGPRGGALAVWRSDTGAPGQYASARAAGTTPWGPTETITTAGDTTGMTNALVAASPVSGQALVLVSDPVPVVGPPSTAPIPVRLSVRAAP